MRAPVVAVLHSMWAAVVIVDLAWSVVVVITALDVSPGVTVVPAVIMVLAWASSSCRFRCKPGRRDRGTRRDVVLAWASSS